ncbi:MAG: hypothetical protein ACTHJR_15865 [Sphingomonas sp.]|uniref:hypothetical protein n=1 Tax=Sphingomonas sp. TaxID=28214 RepID=UPI003F7DC96B
MAGWIDWLRKLDWVQWLALIALLCAYAVIAMPFFGISWERTGDFAELLIILGAFQLFTAGGRRDRIGRAPSGFGHLGAVAMVMMFLWGQPWWSIPRPQQASDFWVFVWPFFILVNAIRVLSVQPPDRDGTAVDRELDLA